MDNNSVIDGVKGKLSGAEAAELSERIAGLTRAGLPLAPGLFALGEELPRGRLRHSIKQLAHTLESGVPLSDAIESQQGNIPAHLRGLVIAGTRSGRLSDVLSRFTRYTSISAELTRRLWINLAYPVLTAMFTGILFLAISAYLVTQFEAIFKDFGVPLPGITILVIRISHAANLLAPPLLLVAALGFVLWLSGFVVLDAARRRSLLGQLPLVGKIWRLTSLAEFCHLLALLIESRLPLAEALRLTGEGVQDSRLRSACEGMAQAVEKGQTLFLAMEDRSFFPRGLSRLIRWGESQQALPEVLHMAGSMFESRSRTHAAFSGTVLTILCVLPIFAMMLVIPSLFLPLITLIGRLSG